MTVRKDKYIYVPLDKFSEQEAIGINISGYCHSLAVTVGRNLSNMTVIFYIYMLLQ